jgi:hypothetical protein
MQYAMSMLQSAMSSQPFSGIATDDDGQDVQGGSASSSSVGATIGSLASSVPSLQLSSDLLSSLIRLISMQAGSSKSISSSADL